MNHLLKQSVLTGFLLVSAFICAHGNASAAASCSLSSPSTLSELISSYNVFASSNSYSIPADTIAFSCSGLSTFAEHTLEVYFLGLSSTYGTYTSPYLSGPDSSKLDFQLCTSSSACTSGFWTATNGIQFSCFSGSSGDCSETISNAIAVNVTIDQNIYVSTADAYTATVHFAFSCDGSEC
jgi:hypothetical protein